MGIELVLPQSYIPTVDLKNEEYTHFSFVSLCKYLLTAELWEQNIDVEQSWLGILESGQRFFISFDNI